jgi:hypothetical protein
MSLLEVANFQNDSEEALQQRNLICAICLNVKNEPTIIDCGHVFCARCLKVPALNKCPLCRETILNRLPCESTKAEVGALILTCPEDGCSWRGPVKDADDHACTCSLCGTPDIFNMDEHRREDCLGERECHICAKRMPSFQLQDHLVEHLREKNRPSVHGMHKVDTEILSFGRVGNLDRFFEPLTFRHHLWKGIPFSIGVEIGETKYVVYSVSCPRDFVENVKVEISMQIDIVNPDTLATVFVLELSSESVWQRDGGCGTRRKFNGVGYWKHPDVLHDDHMLVFTVDISFLPTLVFSDS